MTLPLTERRRAKASQSTIGRVVTMRIYVAGAMLTLLFAGICYRAYGLQIGQVDKYRQLARRQHLRMVELPAPRGPIVDVKGRELAVTADTDSVYANPREVVDLAGTAESLAGILDLDVRALEAKLAMRRHFVWIERHVTTDEARRLRALDLPGIYFTAEPRRFYPGKELAGPVLGFAGIDGTGLDGLELQMNDALVGQKARFPALRDATGRVMMSDGVVKAQAGAMVTLTIDRAVQHIAEAALRDTVTEHQAVAGTIVVLDVATAGVLAMANWPGYDPNAPGRAVRSHARNRAITDAFEIGSIMKVFTIAAALDAGAVTVGEKFDVHGGEMHIGSKLIRDTYRDDELTVGGVIKRSSNVGAVKIARKLGAEALHEALSRFGFGRETGIELPGERAGTLRPPARWGMLGLASMAFGYGMTVTALQIAAGFATVGAGGVYREPRIIHEVRDAAGQVIYQHQPEGRQVMQPETAHSILPMMASVFEKGPSGGTARDLEPPPFPLGGKTGTSRKVDPETRQYSQELYVSSFAGLAPIDAPRIAVVVIIDEPHGGHYYGAQVAGPAFVRVVDETLRYLGVPPVGKAPSGPATSPGKGHVDEPIESPLAIDDAPGALADGAEAGPAAGAGAGAGTEVGPGAEPGAEIDAETGPGPDSDVVHVPDFRGLGMSRVLELARAAGIAVEVEGSGRAVEQYPPPGPTPRPVACRVLFSQAQAAAPTSQ
jgi:cell division protein FtsI (penicillin-binding protein 3)